MRQPDEVTPQELDRLVDGELNGKEYQALLRALEQHPDGWRLCALAFLEAQAFQVELTKAPQILPAVSRDAPGRQAKASKPNSMWAVAAGLLLAFGLGSWTQGWFVEDESAPAGDPQSPLTQVRPDEATDGQAEASIDEESVATTEAETMRLVVNDQEFVEIPTSEADAIDFDEIFRAESREHERILRDLKRQGHVVRRIQQEVPVQLEDGRRARVPVDRIEIVPVRGNYQ